MHCAWEDSLGIVAMCIGNLRMHRELLPRALEISACPNPLVTILWKASLHCPLDINQFKRNIANIYNAAWCPGRQACIQAAVILAQPGTMQEAYRIGDLCNVTWCSGQSSSLQRTKSGPRLQIARPYTKRSYRTSKTSKGLRGECFCPGVQ
eukprot:scaffold16825_cov27-Tisochrysis_lutea.AAC.1